MPGVSCSVLSVLFPVLWPLICAMYAMRCCHRPQEPPGTPISSARSIQSSRACLRKPKKRKKHRSAWRFLFGASCNNSVIFRLCLVCYYLFCLLFFYYVHIFFPSHLLVHSASFYCSTHGVTHLLSHKLRSSMEDTEAQSSAAGDTCETAEVRGGRGGIVRGRCSNQ